MLRNYLTIAWRALRREWGYSTLNILGLALGIAVTLVIALFIQHKLSFDRFHADADRIYRIVQQDSILGHPVATVPRGLPHRMTNRFPEVETATVFFNYGRQSFSHEGRSMFVEDMLSVDRHSTCSPLKHCADPPRKRSPTPETCYSPGLRPAVSLEK